MTEHRFHPSKLERLNDPKRLDLLRPDLLWAALAAPSARVIVDVGAGTGFITAALARFAPDAVVYAVDASEPMLEYLAEHAPDDLASRLRPVLSDGSSIPLADESADVVMMVALYHELDERTAILGEAHRVLRPGGRALIVDWRPVTTVSGPPLELRVDESTIVAELAEAAFRDVVAHGILEDFSVVTATRP